MTQLAAIYKDVTRLSGGCLQGPEKDLATQKVAAQQASCVYTAYYEERCDNFRGLTLPCVSSLESVAAPVRRMPEANCRLATLTFYDSAGTPAAFQWLPGEHQRFIT